LLDETESKYVPLKEKKKKIVISFFDSNKWIKFIHKINYKIIEWHI
jgi:hypothetical protein